MRQGFWGCCRAYAAAELSVPLACIIKIEESSKDGRTAKFPEEILDPAAAP